MYILQIEKYYLRSMKTIYRTEYVTKNILTGKTHIILCFEPSTRINFACVQGSYKFARVQGSYKFACVQGSYKFACVQWSYKFACVQWSYKFACVQGSYKFACVQWSYKFVCVQWSYKFACVQGSNKFACVHILLNKCHHYRLNFFRMDNHYIGVHGRNSTIRYITC